MTGELVLAAAAVLDPGAPPDVSFVPPLVRRRLSPLQRIHFALARAVETVPAAAAVFASRDGEDTLTRRLVADFLADGSVSPQRFSVSVYNAAPGLWSVFTKNRAPYTAVAAGGDSLECGLLEALPGARPALFVYAEETGGGYGAAALFGAAGAEGRRLRLSAGDATRPPLAFADVAAFLRGDAPTLRGRWMTLEAT